LKLAVEAAKTNSKVKQEHQFRGKAGGGVGVGLASPVLSFAFVFELVFGF
jgi:hypothetical protein